MRELFASDNASAAHPAILSGLQVLSRDHEVAYGADTATEAACEALRAFFGTDCGVYFVYNGTGANVSALRCMARAFEAVICTEMAHINEDEGGAPEAIGGFKLLPVARPDGRLRAADITPFLSRLGFEHTSQPAVVSLTQATEVGTIYGSETLREITSTAHDAGLTVHMDGARIANAAATVHAGSASRSRPMSPVDAMRAITSEAGVDVLSFGATKNGLLFGEAVVFFNRDLERFFPFFRKQTTQLHSKMRYIAGQFLSYLRDDLWFESARRANALATELATRLSRIPGVRLAHPVEANGVFVELPPRVVGPLQEEFGFYMWDAERSMARLMVSWDTSERTIDAFAERCRSLCEA